MNDETPMRKVRFLMVNPTDFVVLFTTGMKFRENAEIIEGLPEDAQLITLAADPIRHGIMLVVQSDTYEEIPINQMPPVQIVSINIGTEE